MVSDFRWDGGVLAVVKQSSCVDRVGEGDGGGGGGRAGAAALDMAWRPR